MCNELESRYPIESIIHVSLNCRQKNYSIVKVIGYDGEGYVRAVLVNPKNKNRIRGINIYYKNIKA